MTAPLAAAADRVDLRVVAVTVFRGGPAGAVRRVVVNDPYLDVPPRIASATRLSSGTMLSRALYVGTTSDTETSTSGLESSPRGRVRRVSGAGANCRRPSTPDRLRLGQPVQCTMSPR